MDLIKKEVEFMGSSIVSAKDLDGVIWVGVKNICKNIGLNKNRMDRQIKNIQKDECLNKGYVKFDAGVFDPYNETIAMKLDYVPIWLAKIKITPAMRKEIPEMADTLLSYQLKVKDILAAAFLPNQETNNLQLLEKLKSSIDNRLDKIEKLIKYKDIDYQSKYTDWKSSVFTRIDLLADYHDSNRNQQFAITYRIFESSVEISVNKIKKEFCEENGYSNCFPLDAIEASEKYKTRFDSILQVRINKMNKEIKSKEEIE